MYVYIYDNMMITNEQMMALMQDEKVIDALQSKSHIDLAKFIGRELCGFTTEDEKYVDLFWDATFGSSWIYLSDEIIIDWVGYKKTKSAVSKFIDYMKSKFIEGVDYKEIDNNDELVVKYYESCPSLKRGKHNKKYYAITGKTLQKMLMRAGTKMGEQVCDYFIKTEKLGGTTMKMVHMYLNMQLNAQANQLTEKDNQLTQMDNQLTQMDNQLTQKDNQLTQKDNQLTQKNNQLTQKDNQITKLESRQMKLESFVQQVESLKKEQIMYLATTDSYGLNNRFEYGGVQHDKELKQRLASYNTGRAEGDLYKFVKIVRCNNYRLIEDRLHNILIQFKDKQGSKKEMVHLRYDWLERVVDFVCENYDREIDFVNEHCQQFLHDTIDLEAIVPPAIDINDYLTVTLHRNGRVVRQEKIDVTGWEEKKIDDMFKDAINQCAAKNTNTPYDFSTQKNTTLMNLEWGMLTSYFDGYVGTKKWWRDRVKEWLGREKPTHLRIKGLKMP